MTEEKIYHTLESLAASSRALAAASRSLAISSCAEEEDIPSDDKERTRLLRRTVVVEKVENPCADSMLLIANIDAKHSLAARFDRDDMILFLYCSNSFDILGTG